MITDISVPCKRDPKTFLFIVKPSQNSVQQNKHSLQSLLNGTKTSLIFRIPYSIPAIDFKVKGVEQKS